MFEGSLPNAEVSILNQPPPRAVGFVRLKNGWDIGEAVSTPSERVPVRVEKIFRGDVVKIYDSVDSAEKETGTCASSIRRCCNRALKSAGGFQWRYSGTPGGEKRKPVESKFSKGVQMMRNGAVLSEFKSITEAARFAGISDTGVSSCCSGKRESAGGFEWRYADESERNGETRTMEKGTALCEFGDIREWRRGIEAKQQS